MKKVKARKKDPMIQQYSNKMKLLGIVSEINTTTAVKADHSTN